MAKPTTAVTKPANTAVAVNVDYSGDADSGFENATSDSFAIPFLSILQSGSPQCKRSDGAYVPGAAEGMLYNSVTNEVLDPANGIDIIPCTYQRTFVEWATREAGGGYRGEHPQDTALINQCSRDEKGRDILPNGNQLNDTRTHYVLILSADGVPSPAVITMSSTQIKKSKTWMTAMQNFKLKGDKGLYTPPMFSRIWTVSTRAESNDKGSWFGWHFEPKRMLVEEDHDLYMMARTFAQQIRSGQVKADHGKSAEAQSTVAEPGAYDMDEEAPF